MEYTTKNYMAQGGDELVIGGKLTMLAGATVTGLGGASGAAATLTAPGSVKQAAAVAAAAGATPTKAEFDALVAALKTAGIMAGE